MANETMRLNRSTVNRLNVTAADLHPVGETKEKARAKAGLITACACCDTYRYGLNGSTVCANRFMI